MWFIDILVYIRKDLNSGKEKILVANWSRIRSHRNMSVMQAQFYNNNKIGYTDFIEDLKDGLFYNIDQISFSEDALKCVKIFCDGMFVTRICKRIPS